MEPKNAKERLLLSALKLEKVFTAEQLVIISWQCYQKEFGLRGFEGLHPDSNRILSTLMGKQGLVSIGWFESLGSKRYRVAERGNLMVERLLGVVKKVKK